MIKTNRNARFVKTLARSVMSQNVYLRQIPSINNVGHEPMIRNYKTKDTEAVVEVWKAATAVAHPFLANDFIGDEAENLRNIYLIHAQTRVLEWDDEVAGFIAMIGNEIGGLFLDPELHGHGLGRALVDDVAKQADSLEVEVFERNTVGRRFYDCYGFRQIGSSIHEATGEAVLRLALVTKNAEAAA